MSLNQDRNTPRFDGGIKQLDVAASMLIYAGALVCRDASGNAVKGATALGLHGVGRAEQRVDNSDGDAGDVTARVREGVFGFANSASADEITAAEIGKVCYVVDDQTVAKTSGPGTRSPAGIVADVDDTNVWVLLNEQALAAYLAGRRFFVPMRIATLVGAGVSRVLSPFEGRVVKIWSVIEGVLTTGDATLTARIEGSAITTGVITITQAGSAAGDKDSCVPTAANVVAIGNELSMLLGGSNATASVANVVFEIERD